MEHIIRAFDAKIDSVVEGERAVVARINTAVVDRLKTVIDPLGADVSHFNKTRSVLWHHGEDKIRSMVPIGQGWAKVRKSERDILGKCQFASDDFSDQLFQRYKDGSLSGWSIKAGVHVASPPTRDEIRARPDLEDCITIYRKWDLIEFSATPTPGNSDCVTMLVSRGLMTAPEGYVPPTPIVERYITHSGSKWIVHAEDGKVLGEHDSEEGAKKQLAAVEAHKHEDRTIPYIEESAGTWTIYQADGARVMGCRSMAIAEDCLKLLLATPSSRKSAFAAEAAQILAESRRMAADTQAEIKEYIDLYRYGRV